MNYDDSNDFAEYNRHSYDDDPTPYGTARPNGFATAALVLGILSIVSVMIFYVSIPLAALAIVFAILSRGRYGKMATRAKAGIFLSLAGIILTVTLTIYAVITYLPYIQSGQFSQYLENYLEDYYGSQNDASPLYDWYNNGEDNTWNGDGIGDFYDNYGDDAPSDGDYDAL